MNLFAISGILIGTTSTAMAVLMLFIGKERLHYIWSLFCVSVAIWGFGGYGIATTQDIQAANLLWRLTHVGIIFIPILFAHFVYVFLQKKLVPIIPLLYAIGIFFLGANLFTNLFIANMRWVFGQFYYDSPPGILYIPFTILFFALVIYSHVLLWKELKISHGLKKAQIQYFFLGMGISFAGGGLSFLPVYHIDIYPVLNILAFLYTPILTYAIIKKRLFDIRTVLAQLLVGIIAALLLINFLTSATSFEYVWKGALLGGFFITGYLLIKSVMNEVSQREELQRAYAKLKQLDEAKSEFVSIASHQLRTPLTAIKGYISMLLEGSYDKLSAKQKKPLENVNTSNERLIRLVNDLLNLSRIESGKIKLELQKAKLEEIIQSIIDELHMKAKEQGLKIIFEKPELPLPAFRMDAAKLRNVFLNIIDNAMKYTLKGSITITVRPQPENRNLPTKSVLVKMIDTGEGMSKEELAHLFESFSRGKAGTKMWTEGAGLGLYIAKLFVHMHKGKIWAESPGKGKGSTFFVQIPVQ